jgi:hypothetical protein
LFNKSTWPSGVTEQVDHWGRCNGGIGDGDSVAVVVSSDLRGCRRFSSDGAMGAWAMAVSMRAAAPRDIDLDHESDTLQSRVPAADLIGHLLQTFMAVRSDESTTAFTCWRTGQTSGRHRQRRHLEFPASHCKDAVGGFLGQLI